MGLRVGHPVGQIGNENYKILWHISEAKEPIPELNCLSSQRPCRAWEIGCHPSDFLLREVKIHCLQHLLIILKGRAHGFSHWGYTHFRVFLPEDFCNLSPGLCANIPEKYTPPPPSLLVTQQNACCIFINRKVMWKLRARQSSSSSTRLLTPTSLALYPVNTSPTRPTCVPLYHRSRRRSILAWIYLALWEPSVWVKTTWAKTRGILEFHIRLSTPRHSAARTAVNQLPTFPGGVDCHLANCAASRLQRLCQVASSGTPPYRCFP